MSANEVAAQPSKREIRRHERHTTHVDVCIRGRKFDRVCVRARVKGSPDAFSGRNKNNGGLTELLIKVRRGTLRERLVVSGLRGTPNSQDLSLGRDKVD